MRGYIIGNRLTVSIPEIDYVYRYVGVGEIMTSLDISDAPFGMTS